MNLPTDRERLLFELDEARHRYQVAREDCERAFAALWRLDEPPCALCHQPVNPHYAEVGATGKVYHRFCFREVTNEGRP